MPKSHFKSDLEIELLNERHGVWKLTAPLVYHSNLMGDITVPKGYKTDMASVPRLPVIYALFGNSNMRAAVVHDYLYSQKDVCRADADYVLREASDWRGYPMWAAVRLFGWMFKKGGR